MFLEHAKYKHSPWKCAGCNFKSKDFTLLSDHCENCSKYKRRFTSAQRRFHKFELNSEIECFACGRRLKGGIAALLVHFITCCIALEEDEKRVGIQKSIVVQNINQYATNSDIKLSCEQCKEEFTNLPTYAVHQEKCNIKSKAYLLQNRRLFPNSSDRSVSLDLSRNYRRHQDTVNAISRGSTEETESVQIIRPVIRKRKSSFIELKKKSPASNKSLESSYEPMLKQCKVTVEKLKTNGFPRDQHTYAPKAFKVFTTQMPKERSIKDSNKDLMIQKIFPFAQNQTNKDNNMSTSMSLQNDLSLNLVGNTRENESSSDENTPMKSNETFLCLTQKKSIDHGDTISVTQKTSSFLEKQKEHIIAQSLNQQFLDHDANFLESFLTSEPFVKLKASDVVSSTTLQKDSPQGMKEIQSTRTGDNIKETNLLDSSSYLHESDQCNEHDKSSDEDDPTPAPPKHSSFFERQKEIIIKISQNELSLDYDSNYLQSFLVYKPIVKLKKLELKTTSLTININGEMNDNLIENPKPATHEIETDETETPVANKMSKSKSNKETKDGWASMLKSIRLPIIFVDRLHLKSGTVVIVEGSLHKEYAKLDSLPLSPSFDIAYLDTLSIPDSDNNRKAAIEGNFPLENYPNDDFLIGVTDSNAWLHKNIEAQTAHTKQSSPNIPENREANEDNIGYEILDSRIITIECMNESSDEEEDGRRPWLKQREFEEKNDNDYKNMSSFNPILNLDGLKL